MPLSYQGFGPAAILIMIVCILLAEGYKKLKKSQHH